MNLRYDRNYIAKGEYECVCPSCGVVCGSTAAFDTHRVSSGGVSRICLESPLCDPRLEVDSRGRLSMNLGKPRKDRSFGR